MINTVSFMWVFHGAGGRYSSALFSTREIADTWIKKHSLTGILTRYPIDIGVYEWSIEKKYFEPTKENEFRSEFIQRFTSANMEHYHYEEGIAHDENIDDEQE